AEGAEGAAGRARGGPAAGAPAPAGGDPGGALARRERLLTVATEHEDADARVRDGLLDRARDRLPHLEAHRVPARGVPEDEPRHPVVAARDVDAELGAHREPGAPTTARTSASVAPPRAARYRLY